MNKKNSEHSEIILARKLNSIRKLINCAQDDINRAKIILSEILKDPEVQSIKSNQPLESSKNKEIFGVFNGENMIDDKGKKFSVPVNYASKSKLVFGDKLKLIILDNGTFIYKQIDPIERRKITGILHSKKKKSVVKSNNESYQILPASVSFFRAKDGDKLTIIIPKNKKTKWAAVENKLPA